MSKTFQVFDDQIRLLKRFEGSTLKKVLTFIIPQERKFLKWIIKNYT